MGLKVAKVPLEEIGHFVDSKINKIDAAGDEGDIFARLAQGESISESELEVLKAENDMATVTVDDQVVEIEQNTGLQGSYEVEEVDKSGDYQIDSLIRGDWGKWTNPSSTPTSPLDMTYSFYKPGVAEYGWKYNVDPKYDDNKNLLELQEGIKDNIRVILDKLGSIVNINFSEITEGNGNYKYGQLRYIHKDDTPARHAYPPQDPPKYYDQNQPKTHQRGDVFFSQESFSERDKQIALHETLHALGLTHPDEYKPDGAGPRPNPEKQNLPGSLDQNEDIDDNTVMSYNIPEDNNYSWEPAPYDLKALGYLYNLRETGNDSRSGKETNTKDLYVFDTDLQQGSDTINETTIALKTHHNTYVRADAGRTMYQSGTIGTWEEFQVINQSDGKIALKTFHNNRYVRANTAWLVDQADLIDTWEKFDVIDRGNGNIALKTHWPNYIRAQSVGTIDQTDASQPSTWETFTPIARNRDTDTLDFAATTTKTINVDLSIAGQQTINENLKLTLGITLAGKNYVDVENAVGGSLNDTIRGNNLNNFLRGNNGNDYLAGNLGNDTLDGGAGDDVLLGGEGTDNIYGGAGKDYIYGGTGNYMDNLDGSDGNDTIDGGIVGDLIAGGSGYDSLSGFGGDDQMFGQNDNDTIYGGAGNDTLIGGSGNDTLDGGDNIDTASYFTATGGGVNVTLGNNQAFAINGGDSGIDTLISIEKIIGSNFADSLIGGSGHDNLDGRSGDDTLIGGTGNDTLTGGEGQDTADYSSATQNISIDITLGSNNGIATNDGFGGQDILNGIDNIIGGAGNDTIVGDNNWKNKLEGNSGNDSLSGLGGDDTLDGGIGDDRLFGGEGTDNINGGAGNDYIEGGTSNHMDNLHGSDGNDIIHGGDIGWDLITGGNDNDQLYGHGGNDQMFGEQGNDILTGGAGNDILNGGDGYDTAFFSKVPSLYSRYTSSGTVGYFVKDLQTNELDHLVNIEAINFNGQVITL